MRPHIELRLVRTRLFAATASMAVLCVLLTACGDGGSSGHITSLTITPSPVQVAVGSTAQLTATGKFSNGKTRDLTTIVYWQTSSGGVASVSAAGGVSPISPGQITVRAQYGSMAASTALTVTAAALVSIEVTPGTATVPLGKNVQLKAIGHYADSTTGELTTQVTWQSSNPSVAAVGADGQAASKAIGAATVSATSNAKSGSAALSVTNAALVALSVSADNSVIVLGQKTQLHAQGTFTDNSTQDVSGTVNWTSSAPDVIAIESGAVARAKSVGSASVTASTDTVSSSTNLSSTQAALQTITISTTTAVMPLGTTSQFTATGNYSDGLQQDITSSVQWTSSPTQILSISGSGLAKANAIGSAMVYAALGTTSGSTAVSVSPAGLVSMTISPPSPVVPLGQRQQLSVTATYTDGSTFDLTSYATWSSDNPTVAPIDTHGMAVAMDIGQAKMSASYQGQQATTSLTVQPLLSVSYFTADKGVPDSTLRIVYPDANATDLCAMIYVFDKDQQMSECCGCTISKDGMLTLSYQDDLLSNPLTGIKSTTGSVVVLSADQSSNPKCDASTITPSGALSSWSTSLQPVGQNAYAVTENAGSPAPLGDVQSASIQAQCSFVKILGSGQGSCSCGSSTAAASASTASSRKATAMKK